MKKKEFDFRNPENAMLLSFHLGNGQGVMISCTDAEKKTNGIMTVTWMTPTSHHPLLFAVSIGNGKKEPGNDSYRFCHHLIDKTKVFGINVPTIELTEAVTKVGTTHSDEVDKFQEIGLTPFDAKHIISPLIEECFMNVECKVIKQMDTGDHTIFVAEPLAVYINDDVYVDGKFTPKYRDINNLIYLGNMAENFGLW